MRDTVKKKLKITKAKAKHLIGKLVTILYLIIYIYITDISRFIPDAQYLTWIGGLGIVDKWDLPRMSIACRRRNPMPLAENQVSGRCGAVMQGKDLKWTCTDIVIYKRSTSLLDPLIGLLGMQKALVSSFRQM